MHILQHGATSRPIRAAILHVSMLLIMTGVVRSLNVSLPESFEQCLPAIIGLNQSKGNVSILIREEGVGKALVNVTLPTTVTSWTWPAVNVSAGENITILITDRSTKRKSTNELAIDSSPTNDTSCLPLTSDTKKHKGGVTDQPSSSDSDGGNDNGFSDPASAQNASHHKTKTTEVSVIAGVLGGLLLALVALILIMYWRRRREAKNHATEDTSKDTIMAHRIGEMGERLDRHRVVTLFSEDGRAEGQAILGREGDAGWSYMSRLAPGLQTTPLVSNDCNDNVHSNRTGRRRTKTRRYDNESKDGDLPSYGYSEYEKKALPKYADEGRLAPSNGARILTTRHDSQGSRLTFSSATTDRNAIPPTPRQSSRSQRTPFGEEENDEVEEVISFRPAEGETLLSYASDGLNREFDYSNASQDFQTNRPLEASSTSIQSHPTAERTGHRRSRSEACLRQNLHDNSPFY
ncbi:hypothetical protein CBS101457_003394 [Exobasidium rhododendri]|nr:hypothetical protein CBS101457_003394 [Exobasidium rhododendri]